MHAEDQLSNPAERVAVVGANCIAERIYRHPELMGLRGDELAGVIRVRSGGRGQSTNPFPQILGDLSEIEEIVSRHHIDRLVLAIDGRDVETLHRVIQVCDSKRIPYSLVGDDYDLEYGLSLAELIGRFFRTIDVRPRRLIDIGFAVTILILSLPMWIVLSLLIKFGSGGSILCSSQKVGKGGNVFREFRFNLYGQPSSASVHSMNGSPRFPKTTAVGGMIQRFRLESLPNLLNLLAGDISLVGPSPENPYFHERYLSDIPFYENRLKVRPGILGYSQVEVGYHALVENIREKLKYDFYYVDHSRSFFLNLKVFFKTVVVLLRSSRA